ncbi:MAG TPA: FliH/SctL family protein [Gammaproteobacteria bacterium]|nr:FliH/SctL family protein [Gammaproteobacteria bacterium]
MTRIIRAPGSASRAFKLTTRSIAATVATDSVAAAPAVVPDSQAVATVSDSELDRLRRALAEAEARVQELERQVAERDAAQDQDLAERRKAAEREASAVGYEQGLKLGEAAGRAELAESVAAFAQLLAAAKAALSAGLMDLEELAVEIAMEGVTKVLGRELGRAEGVLALIREVASRAREQAVLTVRLGERDYSLLQEHHEALSGALGGVRVELVSDQRVAFGGCLVETENGTLDGRLDQQLRRLKEAIVTAQRQRDAER